MRHKLPYMRDTDEKGESLSEGVVAHQTMRDCSDVYDKQCLEREVSKAGREAHQKMQPTTSPFYDDYGY